MNLDTQTSVPYLSKVEIILMFYHGFPSEFSYVLYSN